VLPPAVTLWDGFSTASGEFDPRFVGELLSTHPAGYNRPGTPARDWRLLPDSPLIDKALSPNGGDLIVGMNNVVYAESSCDKVMTFDWDGEEYGNPRRVGAAIDIGFDEFHQMIMCGSYANDSNSHGSLNPSAPHLNASAGQGTTTRVILLPPQAAGHQMRLFGVLQQIPAPPRPIAAWTRPKGTLAIPYVDPNRPPDYRRRYINDGHPGCSPTGTLTWPYRVVSQLPVTPFVWSQPLGAPAQVLPPGQGSSQVLVVVQLDNDGLAPNTVCTTPILEAYFSTQAEIVLGAPFDEARWTNLQVEYR